MPKQQALAALATATRTYTLSQAVTNEDVYVARLHQTPTTDYTINNAVPSITLTYDPSVGDEIEVYGDLLSIITSSGVSASKTGFATAGTIINRVAAQVGITATRPSVASDPYGQTDQNYVQLCELLNMVGEDLQNKTEWAHFIREASLLTAGSATQAAVPADFYKMIDQTHWNRSTRYPMIGPLSGQETQYLRARLAGVMIQVGFRLMGNVIQFAVAPSNGQTLSFEYLSSYWVWSAAGTQPDSTGAVATGDTVLFDTDLAIAGLKLAYLEAKGFDTIAARERYEDVLEHAVGKNVGAKLLTIGGIGVNADHLIDASNLPVTGYG